MEFDELSSLLHVRLQKVDDHILIELRHIKFLVSALIELFFIDQSRDFQILLTLDVPCQKLADGRLSGTGGAGDQNVGELAFHLRWDLLLLEILSKVGFLLLLLGARLDLHSFEYENFYKD